MNVRSFERTVMIGLTLVLLAGTGAYLGSAVLKVLENRESLFDARREVVSFRASGLYEAREGSIDGSRRKLEELRKKMYVTEGSEPYFLRFLQPTAPGLAASVRMRGASADPLPSGARIVPIEIDLDGGFPETVAYLNALDRGPYLLVVDRISVSSAEEGGVTGRIEGHFYLR
jgi:hypothetical protein